MSRRTVLTVILRVFAFLAFVWLCQVFFSIGEVGGCLDDGGAVDESLRVCIGGRHGQWQMVSGGSYISWLASLGVPALIVFAAYSLVRRWLFPRKD